jgi:hypothetical protein
MHTVGDLETLRAICRLALCPETLEDDWQNAATAFFGLCRSRQINPFRVELPREERKHDFDFKMPKGKYKGRSMCWIVENDAPYAEWCVENMNSAWVRNKFLELFEEAR